VSRQCTFCAAGMCSDTVVWCVGSRCVLRRPDEALGRHAHREVLTLVVFAIMTLPQEVWMSYLILHHGPEHSGLLVAFRVEFLIQRGLRTFRRFRLACTQTPAYSTPSPCVQPHSHSQTAACPTSAFLQKRCRCTCS
jgi:hypothetical protein